MKGWQRLSTVDRALSRVVPKDLYYNVEITGCKVLLIDPGRHAVRLGAGILSSPPPRVRGRRRAAIG